jgi:hypothetical protein
MDTPTSQRFTFKQVRACLPTDPKHAVLRLMPMGTRAPVHYRLLQAHVYATCAPGLTPLERADELLALWCQYDRHFADVPQPEALLVEIADHVVDMAFTFQAAEVSVVAGLNRDGVRVEENVELNDLTGLPVLVSEKNEPLAASSFQLKKCLNKLDKPMAHLGGLTDAELSRLPDAERRSALRLLRLFLLYGGENGPLPGPLLRQHFFETQGLGLWRALAKFAKDGRDAYVYGKPGLTRMRRAVHSAALNYRAQRANRAPDIAVDMVVAPVPTAPETDDRMHVVVRDPFPTTGDRDEKQTLQAFERLREPRPLALLPGIEVLDESRAQLLKEFPWAASAIDTIFFELRARRLMGGLVLGFRPLLLRGPAGSGKTRLARRLGEVLGVATHTLNAAGMADSSSITGTARGWSTGQPSPLLRALLGESATALVVLDEIDKAADLTRNSPPVQSALLPLLDREEARRWRDNYLQVECDLSCLIWVLTCNDVTWMSAALRSRLNIIDMRRPSRSELYSVVDCAVMDLEAEWRLPPGVLKGMPISALLPRRLSSLRDLQRGVARAASLWINSTSTERH